jgi:hypothetical protein
MPRFTNVDFADMHFTYGFCDGNSVTAVREYQHCYPDWKLPYLHAFEMVYNNLRETGYLISYCHVY